jgi:hypothetical protein
VVGVPEPVGQVGEWQQALPRHVVNRSLIPLTRSCRREVVELSRLLVGITSIADVSWDARTIAAGLRDFAFQPETVSTNVVRIGIVERRGEAKAARFDVDDLPSAHADGEVDLVGELAASVDRFSSSHRCDGDLEALEAQLSADTLGPDVSGAEQLGKQPVVIDQSTSPAAAALLVLSALIGLRPDRIRRSTNHHPPFRVARSEAVQG